ncbi:hypothetical protein BCON_0130g00160 [Botryotinia convoluta]|uniref:Uncharacterized protein n=1 Tax=Botryotinia convoluta TaxID=54673 RepID=A0A4Z1HV74_9HELO|nr:hypothetical protein BCON_0130g00160 [Botryotinia convoluta]
MAHDANDTPTARHRVFRPTVGIETGGKSGGKVPNNMQLDIYWLPHTHAASVQQLPLRHHRSSE